MENEIEDVNSQNDIEDADSQNGEESVETLKQKNQELYEQLQKAKGKVRGEDGKWTKKTQSVQIELKPAEKQETLDRIDRAVLRVEKITQPDEISLVESIIKETGKTLDQVLESKYFQSELKEMRELRLSKDAIPTGTKRSAQSTRDSVDYWIAKGEFPPASEVKLRRDVVNAKMASEKNKSHFSTNPVV